MVYSLFSPGAAWSGGAKESRSEKMPSRQLLAAAVITCLVGTPPAGGDEVRYYDQDGVTYRETRRTVLRPVCETQLRPSTQTVYREEQTSELRETQRTWWTPVTEYRCEAYWAGRWNPFVDPYLSYRLVPRTCWENRSEVVQVPVTCRRLVPETRTVQVPVTTRRMVTEEVITRVAVGGGPSATTAILSPTPTVSRPERVGGVARLDKDPPRQGVSTAWRRASATAR
jgi:hypothetical protein